MIIHLVDGTYELFRHFYGLRRFVFMVWVDSPAAPTPNLGSQRCQT
jgi:hypothetical protein